MIGNRSARRRGCRAAVALAALSVLADCSVGTPTHAGSIDPSVQDQLRQDVRSVAAALATHHLREASAALNALTADTAAASTAGKLSSTQLTRIRGAAATLAGDLERATSAPATTRTVSPTPAVTVTTTAPPPPPSQPQPGSNGGAGPGKDKGKDQDTRKDTGKDNGPGKGKGADHGNGHGNGHDGGKGGGH